MSAFPLTAGTVAAACGGRVVAGDSQQALPTFSIDTRTLRAGDTFIALAGPQFDGHAFIDAAAGRGARAAIVSRDDAATQAGSAGLIAILVGDTLDALQALARHVRRLSGARVVAVTGSAGKTTTKEAIATLLSGRFRTLRNRGNLNNHIGLPLSLLDLQAGAEVAVVELGMNHFGEIATLVGIAEPDVRVWINVGTAHLEFFGSMDAIADAKAEILEGATSGTLLVANADDARVMTRASGFAGRTRTFGVEREADVRGTVVRDRGVEGQDVDVKAGEESALVSLSLPGGGHLLNVLAAIAVATAFGIPLHDATERAATLKPGSHRGEVLHLGRGVRVIDDSYNSSPAALLRTLETVAASSAAGRKVAVLGEMLELGEGGVALHRDCGRAAAKLGVSALVAVGGAQARALADAAAEAGLGDAAGYVANSDEAATRVRELVGDGDLVLVKGSRGIRLERVVERLKQDFS